MTAERKRFLLETVLPSAAKSGRFGKGLNFLRCASNDEGKTGDQFASSVVFINAVFTDSDGGERTFKLVLKFLPESVKMREIMNSDAQFHNENVMYKEIVPFLDYDNITTTLFPEFYYGNTVNADGQESIVVIEDLSNKNFGLSKFRLFLDYDHVILALQALGRFHGLSYIAKQINPVDFFEKKEKLLEHVWNRGRDGAFSVVTLIGPCALRGVKAFCELDNNDTLDKLTRKLETESLALMKWFVTPEEPSAVICHGDFCNHNMLFSYDEQNKPTSVRLIDLQTSRYASPVIDLSMILFLNTEYELRSRHWDKFLFTYHDAVTKTVTAGGCTPPKFESLLDELKRKAFYAYFHCSYFLPMMVNQVHPDFDDDSITSDPQELMQHMLQMGGEKGIQPLISILKHMQELDYFSFL